ncbi:hypothetical protein QS257_06790 [Terrilactibacillus sp. S3-3]|nr:hypothetical protein QS257_06790 [Terrilactibacillus sp. S3-3]
MRQLKDRRTVLKNKLLTKDERQVLEKKAHEQRQRLESEWAMRESLPARERASKGSIHNKWHVLFPAAGFLLTLIFTIISAYTVSTKTALFVFAAGASLSLLFSFAFSAILREANRKPALRPLPVSHFAGEAEQGLETQIEADNRRQVEIRLSDEQLGQAKKRYMSKC